jgi:hypothetical protein
MGVGFSKAALASPEQSLGRRHNDASQTGFTQPRTLRLLFVRTKSNTKRRLGAYAPKNPKINGGVSGTLCK